jgi:hypothetical protein
MFGGDGLVLGCLRNRITGPLPERVRGMMSKRVRYRARAAEHSQLAETCQSKEAREIHHDLAEWFLLLADDRWLEVGPPIQPVR